MMKKGEYGGRLRNFKRALADVGLSGGVVVPGPNLHYFTGVNSLLLERPFMLLVPVDGEAHLIAPRLEAGPYRDCPVEMVIHDWTDSQGWEGPLGAATKELDLKGKWGVEGRAPFLFLHRLLRHATIELEDAEPLLQGLREVKGSDEVALLRRSAEILSAAFEEFPNLIRDGMTELELARRATEVIYGKGATRVDDLLVQSGPNGANPHWLPSSRKIQRGEGIVVDISSSLDGYFADITRTFSVGKPRSLEKVYERVLEAEVRGIGASRVGVMVGEVDAAARGSLTSAGLGEYFIHRTGHGLGLEVHEAPYIVEGGTETLREGMCFTVEPGAYLPGDLGVRLEDDVLIENGKGVELSTTPKDFGWWL